MVNIKKIFISAGESSGDIYGAKLAMSFKGLYNGVKLYGMGLNRMKAAGVQIDEYAKKHSVMGITEIITSLYASYTNVKKCAEVIESEHIDAVVLIDYAGFNLKLAEAARRLGKKVFYFIPPKLWAWGAFRMSGLKKSVDKVYSIFKFEDDFFVKNQINSVFLGHPIFDIIKLSGFDYDDYLFNAKKSAGAYCRPNAKESPADGTGNLKENYSVKNKVILMPGSRKSEISTLLPVIIESAEAVNKLYRTEAGGFEFILPIAPSTDETLVKKYLKRAKFDYRFVYSDFDKYKAFSEAVFAMVSSGTATLELALFGVPMVILYKVAALTELAGRILLKTKYIGLPNILAKTLVVPELVQRQATCENIIYHASKLIPAGHLRQTATGSLLKTADYLKYERGRSPSDQVASDIYSEIGGCFESDKQVL